MKGEWFHFALLRTASWLAPSDQRTGWLREWHSELWYMPQRGATMFCLGAFRDAFWLRRNSPNPARPARTYLDSPLNCLALLAALAGVSMLVAMSISAGGPMPLYPHLRAHQLPIFCIVTLVLSGLLAPAALVVGRSPADRQMRHWPGRLRRGLFLALKIVLVQPVLLCFFLIWMLIPPVALFAPYTLCVVCILALRWIFTDQRRRCPVCLRLLTNPVRIGAPSQTFLAWYGAEWTCSRGHGLLHLSEIPDTYGGESEWLTLDDSWSGLFVEAAEAPHR